jgi:hypothetical protein
MAESKFDKVAKSIERKEGYSPAAAKATAAKIGRESMGKTAFQAKAAAGRRAANKK